MLFRNWIRFVVILVLLPGPVSIATLIYFRTYQATTNIWVQDPTYIGSDVNVIGTNSVPGWNQYLTPAQNETDDLGQYLQTKAFLDAVGVELKQNGVADATERDKLIYSIPRNLHVTPIGSHLVSMTFSCDKAAYCASVLSATITVFQDLLVQALKNQEQLSTSFLQSQLVSAQQRSDSAEAALESYKNTHPTTAVPDSGTISGNPELDKLVSAVSQAREKVSQLQNQVASAQFTFAAADSFIKTNTQVVDQPRITSGGFLGDGASVRRAALVWVAALGVAAVYLVLLVWTDKTARDTREIVSRLNVPVLATVPLLTAKEMF
ncbi:MAG TPA: hypothetical protein VJT78_00875 [Candidatus Dormibacteraeota bacterium]|nr:hypothetical protein [Candidatus Dormibacteraeota bacterium]